jgi:hypothetical protein
VFRSLRRAVTAQDYEALAREFSGVGKVRATATHWNSVTLYVAPQGGGYVSDVLEDNLLAYFEDKRPVTTTIEIKDVEYVRIYVTAQIAVKGYYPPAQVREQVQKAGAALLAFENVDFGRTLYLSKFYEAMEAIDGVAYVSVTEFRREDQKASVEETGKLLMNDDDIPIQPGADEPAYGAGIQVIVLDEGGE